MSNLVIVESPNKVKTIQKYLGDNYKVCASVGHIYKMKTSGQYGLGIDTEKWEPLYGVDITKRKVLKEIKDALAQSDMVYIATDPDREGEAIGEHLIEYLKIQKKYKRVKYNEITKEAILQAFSNPIMIDEDLVDAQKARRMLDRIIGFRLSKLLQSKIYNTTTNASAGRVQSIALKLVCDREVIIENFVPTKYFKLTANFAESDITALYYNDLNESGRKDWILENQLNNIKEYFSNLKKSEKILTVKDINITEKKLKNIIPFKQSVLYRKSPYTALSTQTILQKLYEGYGDGGLISYPRTDSTMLSETFIKNAREYVAKKYGKSYIADEIKGFKGDQNAHEAIRPTNLNLTPELAKETIAEMSDSEYVIYKIIYENTLKSIIKPPVRNSKTYTYVNGEYEFKNSFSSIKYDGYYVVEKNKEVDVLDPNYEINQEILIDEFVFTNHETKPIARYNDGSLIEALDNIKVGRPSTFAQTVKIIKDRQYVDTIEGGALKPTELGKIVLNKLITNFPKIINEQYTAEVEAELDLISEHKLNKNDVMTKFWDKFTANFNEVQNNMEVTVLKEQLVDEKCPECGDDLIIRLNRKKQKFIGCKGFPKCTFTKSVPGKRTKRVYKKTSN